MTIHMHQCRILLSLTPEQFERFLDAAAIETTGEEAPPTEPPPAAATPSNVVPFPREVRVSRDAVAVMDVEADWEREAREAVGA